MKFVITFIFIFIFNVNYALSDSLYDALKITYKNNKELNAERENVNIAEQDLKILLAITNVRGNKNHPQGIDYTFNDMEDFSHFRFELKYFF